MPDLLGPSYSALAGQPCVFPVTWRGDWITPYGGGEITRESQRLGETGRLDGGCMAVLVGSADGGS